jgi:hypothetical protein
MRRTAVLVIVAMLTVLASLAAAGDKASDDNKLGRLFLFQKCDPSLAQNPAEEPPGDGEAEDPPMYDSYGCPLPGNGPWPIFPGNRRWGQMKYNLLGDEFKFSFQGKRLLPDTDYTLIYYPDPWPGAGLICLGGNRTNSHGNVQIHGKMEIDSGLPASYDANFNPVGDSGATGAKIWLVPSTDVDCDGWEEVAGEEEDAETIQVPSQMIGWNPADYLFEGNLIVFQHFPESIEDTDVDEQGTDETMGNDSATGDQAEKFVGEVSGSSSRNGNRGDNGKAKGKNH